MRETIGKKAIFTFLRDEQGGASLYVIIFLVVGAMAVSAIFIDYARLYITRRGAQNGVDAAVLAGAGECAQKLNQMPVVKKGRGWCGVPEVTVAALTAQEYLDKYSTTVRSCGKDVAMDYAIRNGVNLFPSSASRAERFSVLLPHQTTGWPLKLNAVEIGVADWGQSFPPLISGQDAVDVPAAATAEAYPVYPDSRKKTYFKTIASSCCDIKCRVKWYEVSVEVAWLVQLDR